MVKCAVSTCSNVYNKGKKQPSMNKFHRFPNDLKLRMVWIKLCGRKDQFNTEYARVCDDHFPENIQHTLQCKLMGTNLNIQKKCACRIPEGEVPSLNLPSSKELTSRQQRFMKKEELLKRKKIVDELLRANSEGVSLLPPLPKPDKKPGEGTSLLPPPPKADKNAIKRKIEAYQPIKSKAEKIQRKAAPGILVYVPGVPGPSGLNNNKNLESDSEATTSGEVGTARANVPLNPRDYTNTNPESEPHPVPQFVLFNKDDELLSVKEERLEVFSESEHEEEVPERTCWTPVDENTPGAELPVPISELCRVCALAHGDMVQLYGDEGRRLMLEQKINLCLPITVQVTDTLPLQVCRVCILRLELSHKLSTTCQKADTKLKNLEKDMQDSQYAAMKLCSIEYNTTENDDALPLPQPSEPKAKFLPSSANKLPVWCKICDILLCTTDATKLHYLNIHKKSACEFCYEIFDNNEELLKHINKNHIHTCKFCDFKIIGLGEQILRNHINNIHYETRKCLKNPKITFRPPESIGTRSGIFECNTCHLMYSSKQSLKKHHEVVHKQFICLHCLTAFASEKEMEIHVIEKSHELTCKYCFREFQSNRGLTNHLTTAHKDSLPEPKDTDFDCKVCSAIYVSRKNLTRHYEKVHFVYNCGICNENFNDKNEFEKHSTETNHFMCDICNKKFEDVEEMKDHMEQHKKGFESQCHLCKKRFYSKSTLMTHIRSVHLKLPKKHPCVVCEKRFKTPKKLREHIKRHRNERNIECKICNKKFFDEGGLKVHSEVHATERKYVCEHCGKKFAHQRNLGAHIIGVHTSLWKYNCDECDKEFDNELEIMAHCKAHPENVTGKTVSYTKKSPYYCNQCDKYFANKLYFVNHNRNHKLNDSTSEMYKPYECNICNKRFTEKRALRRHLFVHISRKPFVCTDCNRSFVLEKDLLCHMKLHSGEKPFACWQCDKRFHRRVNLTVHVRNVHKDVRKIPCPYCGKLFKRKPQLNVHIRSHTQERPYKCSICDQTFIQCADLYRHTANHEGADERFLKYKKKPSVSKTRRDAKISYIKVTKIINVPVEESM